ncbi:hypothetical protein C731_1484 [Mycolicibacterium hassiacum DSM 44199]|uniref:Uncharacterized protein n=1 Tax=Mycolicibacterium hassiacum (strain DSM 44199 / CIP 105218 / JCM 12690 / 3849) TaxID=1122247 RepID=K5BKB0_MYCHD|nr:hypothetical protein C731_1484 [Mycolicibacterium hassiacum DSM 44199]
MRYERDRQVGPFSSGSISLQAKRTQVLASWLTYYNTQRQHSTTPQRTRGPTTHHPPATNLMTEYN